MRLGSRGWPGLALLLSLAVLAGGCGQRPAGRLGGAAATRAAAVGAAGGRTSGGSAPAGRSPAGRGLAHGSGQPPPAPTVRAVSRQLITVTTGRYGATYATFEAYRGGGGHWHRVFGPWTARIGRGGFAPPGGKREGDGRTPSGSFGFQFLFGALPNPGVRLRYRRARPYDFWDDDPASAHYNQWVDSRHASPGASPEPMDVSGYDYGAVIGYNTARTPGLGSGIFLHVNIGIATAGCITLPTAELLAVLRWLNPARSPRIRMGVGVGAGT